MFRVEWPFVLKASLLDQFPFIVHGFGTKHFQEKELRELCQSQNLEPVFLHQAHSSRIHYLEEKPAAVLEGDALVTSKQGLLLLIKTADCLPVLIFDPANRIIASAHCGWRGTSSRLLEKLIDFLVNSFGSRPENLSVAFGPCISRDCYEVGPEVRDIFSQSGFPRDEKLFSPHPLHPGRFFLDLRLANRNQLLTRGIRKEKIEEITICPHCHPDFLSFRRDAVTKARLFNFIGLLTTDSL